MRITDAHQIGNSVFKTKTHLISKNDCIHKSSVDSLVLTRVSAGKNISWLQQSLPSNEHLLQVVGFKNVKILLNPHP